MTKTMNVRTVKKKIRQILSVFILVIFCISGIGGSVSTLPLDQVKVGMKGIGRSAFTGDQIEEFNVEILGVLHNIRPKSSLILARLTGSILDKTGMISGMSGSPVYIDGKLIGAIAYNFPFSKEAIAGITPIEEMLAISGKKIQRSSYTPRIPLKKHLSLEELFKLNKEFFRLKSVLVSQGQVFTPLNIPLVFSGFTSDVFEKARSFFSQLGFSPIKTGSSAQTLEQISPPLLTLKEGDPVAIQLVRGDMDLSAVGTVTHVDGNRILAFGHSMYNLGPVDYPMTKAKVITIVPSLSTSFKIAAADKLVGTFNQDRASGLFGELGKDPHPVPVNARVTDSNGEIENFKIEIVNDKILTPFFINIALSNLLSTEERSIGDLSLQLQGDIFLEDGRSIHIEDLFSGNFDSSVENISTLFSAVTYFLANNEFKELGIHRINLDVLSSEEILFSYMEKVWLNKYEVSPGERIDIKVFYRTFRGESNMVEVPISAPHLPPGSEFHLIIADASSMHQIEMSQYKRGTFVPRSLSQLIRILNNLRKNNRIYFKMIASKPGLFLKGEEMPNLPPTMKFMFSSPRAAASNPTELNKSTLREYQLPVPYVFKGMAIIPIKIKQ